MLKAVEGAEDSPTMAAEDLRKIDLCSHDVLVGIATSGRTPYVIGALDYARSQGAFTIGLACNKDALLSSRADISIIPVVGPEVLSGSTRMKAGTATKMVLNMLSTGAMVQMGKTYGNLMVDLRCGSEKLKDRARRILVTVTDITYEDADALLRRAKWNVKAAIVMQKAGLTLPQALTRLKKADDLVREAIGEDIEPRLREVLRS
jgi:N-acetylmuramic acid 6-phosphate etherase